MTFLELQREGRKKMDSTLKWYFFDFFYDAINIIEKIPQNEYNPFTCIADVDYEKCEAGMMKWPDFSRSSQDVNKELWKYHQEGSNKYNFESKTEFGEEMVGLNCYFIKNVTVVFSENTKVFMKIKKELSEDITTFEQDFDVMLKTCNGYEGIIASEINENNDCQTVIIKFDISFFND